MGLLIGIMAYLSLDLDLDLDLDLAFEFRVGERPLKLGDDLSDWVRSVIGKVGRASLIFLNEKGLLGIGSILIIHVN
tara:strand:+ start:7793 stop:8023 length:231 start_codon:yes stop_codon:yes gene_type:complete